MRPLTLELKDRPHQNVDLSPLAPDRLAGMSPEAIKAIPLWSGKTERRVSNLFSVSGENTEEIVILNACERLDRIGAQMRSGRITVEGHAGAYVGQDMRGGSIHVRGSCAEYAGAGMIDGMLRIDGDAGDFVGGAIPGERQGMKGGTVMIRGRAGGRVGDHMRRGNILIEGDAGDYCASRMVAGTIVVLGQAGFNAGFGMRRGSLLLARNPKSLPATFNDSGYHDLGFLVLLLSELRKVNKRFAPDPARKRVHSFLGDLAARGQGEVLIWSG